VTRADQPHDPILRDEIAFQLWHARREPRVVAALRAVAEAAKAAETARQTTEWAARAFREAEVADWTPGELVEAFGK
jgi:hypothetical protein